MADKHIYLKRSHVVWISIHAEEYIQVVPLLLLLLPLLLLLLLLLPLLLILLLPLALLLQLILVQLSLPRQQQERGHT